MKKLVFIILLISSFNAFTQVDTTSSKMTFGGGWGVGLGYRFLNTRSSEWSEIKEIQDSLERPILSNYFQLGWEMKVATKSNLSFGLGFISQGFKIDTLANAGIVNYKERYSYALVPLRYIHHSLHSSHQFLWSVGISPKFLINSSVLYDNVSGEKNLRLDATDNKLRFGIDLSLSVGVRSLILKHYSIYTSIYGMQSVIPASNGDLPHYLNSWGISFLLMKKGKKS